MPQNCAAWNGVIPGCHHITGVSHCRRPLDCFQGTPQARASPEWSALRQAKLARREVTALERSFQELLEQTVLTKENIGCTVLPDGILVGV